MHLLVARACLGAFAAQFVILEVALRGSHGAFGSPGGAASVVASVLAWGLAGSAARRGKGGRWALAATAATVVTLEAAVHRFYGVVIDGQLLASAFHSWADIAPVLRRAALPAVGVGVLVTAVEALLLEGAASAGTGGDAGLGARETSGFAGPTRRRRLQAAAALALVGTLFFAPRGRTTPDVELLRAVVGGRHRAEARTVGPRTAPTKPLDASAGRALRGPAVLFVLTESVRASDYGEGSGTHLAIDALLPDRVTFDGMRSIASYTAVSVAALLTGEPQTGPRDDLLGAPISSVAPVRFASAARRRRPRSKGRRPGPRTTRRTPAPSSKGARSTKRSTPS